MKVLMVCLGNICRSPMAEGILRHKAEEAGIDMEIDSAGTGGWHVGEKPDSRAIFTANKFGVDISYQRARQFKVADFDEFDRIYVMDKSNYADVISLSRGEADSKKVEMILNMAQPGKNMPVPDPYYGGDEGFDNVFKLLSTACDEVINSAR